MTELKAQLRVISLDRYLVCLEEIASHHDADIFREPVDLDEEPEYRKKIKHPMDLSTIRKLLQAGKIPSLAELHRHLELMFSNALEYNPSRHPVAKQAVRLRALTEQRIQVCHQLLPHWPHWPHAWALHHDEDV